MVNSKRSKHLVSDKINRSRRYIMKGGDPSQRMLGNVLRILEFEFPASYKKASSESTRWFDWKRQLAWSGL
jgi:hypothetical protein